MKHFETPKHFSHNFELNLDKIPTKKTDRLALKITYPGMLFGIAMIVIGLYEMFIRGNEEGNNYSEIAPKGDIDIHTFLNPTFFDVVLILLGVWVIFSLVISYIRYKKVWFDGKNIEMVTRSARGIKNKIKESVNNYEGVMLRIEYFQFGFMTRRRYVVELAHKDINKIAPLYISLRSRNVRSKWEYYAKKFNLPALMLTDEGVEIRKLENIDKSLIELAASGIIKPHVDLKHIPEAVAYTVRKDKTVIKSRKINWDIYNILCGIAVVFIVALIVAAGFISQNLSWELYSLGTALLITYLFMLFRKDKIVIKRYKIVIVQKFMLFSRKKEEVIKNAVEDIEVIYNPVNERRFLAISSDEKTAIFGEKLSAQDLKWVRDFLITEIVK